MAKDGTKLTVHKMAQDETSNIALLRMSEEIGDSGLMNNRYAWFGVKPGTKEGDVLTVPNNFIISEEVRTSVDDETGEEVSFTWFRFDRK
jgi:hypothetical protein